MSFTVVALLLFSNDSSLNAAPFDTGMITLQQPDRTEFTGRIWGDEFFFWAETEDGYRFIQSGDGWYYYAQLNEDGEFSPSKYKVGIDSPPEFSYQLDGTQSRIDDINQQIEDFKEQLEINRQWFAQKQEEAQGQVTTLKVGIILIEFSDTTHFTSQYRPDGYTTADFDSLMFSYNYWYEPDPQFGTPHPENEAVFGSFRDYWDQMSRGKLLITGKVVNPDRDQDGVPEWLKASGTREYYFDEVSGWDLAVEAYQLALDSGYISEDSADTNYYDKCAVIYALEAPATGYYVAGGDLDGKIFYLAERSGPNLVGGTLEEKSFTHIGVYLHEFGHTIGLNDEYDGRGEDGHTHLFNFCLMAGGMYNVPDRKAACPATLSPFYRILYDWANSVTIDKDTLDFIVEYDFANPKLYRIDPIYASSDEHYIIETKNREGFDLYIPGDPADTVNQAGTLLVWQHYTHSNYPISDYQDRIRVKSADYIYGDSTQLSDFFPATLDLNNYQDFNDTTAPATTINDTHPLLSLPGDPAHFALNGIQKLTNGNTLIESLKLLYGLSTFNKFSGWQLLSVPLVLGDYSIETVFPGCEVAYKFDGTYIQVDTLENGPGYWAKFDSSRTVTMFGDYLKYLEIPVDSGWNIVGSINFDNPVANVCTEPPGIIDIIYGYKGGYVFMGIDSTLKPGEGYWENQLTRVINIERRMQTL